MVLSVFRFLTKEGQSPLYLLPASYEHENLSCRNPVLRPRVGGDPSVVDHRYH